MNRLTFLILCLMFSAAFAIAQTPQTIQTGFTVERELGETEKHIYEINLTKGQMLNFVVEQRGIDVMLRVTTADGKFVDRVDTPNGREGDEPVKVISLESGRYRVEISRFSEETARTTGKYFVKTVEIRKATDAEIKSERLKTELLKIVAEDNRLGSYPDALRRFYADRGLLTNSYGYVADAAEWIQLTAQNPSKPSAGYSAESEFSGVRLEDFGDTAVLSVRRDMHIKNPAADEDYTTIHQIGYVFKRTNGEWRIINMQKTFISREFKPIKTEAGKLDKLVGVYQGGKASETLTVSREENTLFAKLGTNGEKFELLAETENTFYNFQISIAFVRDANGTVTQAVVYHLSPADRITIQPKIK